MRVRGIIINISFSVAVFTAVLFMSDKILSAMSYPDEVLGTVAYSSNFYERIRWVDHYYTYQANSQGIRYPEIPFEKKSPNERRMVVLGDSFVEGQGVDVLQTFSALLENKFTTRDQKYLFINCGVAGAGPYDYERILRLVGLAYHPDSVLVAIYANDLGDMVRDSNEPSEPLPPLHKPLERKGIKRLLHDFFPKVYTIFRTSYVKYKASHMVDVVKEGVDGAHQLGISEEKIQKWVRSLPPDDVKATNDLWLGEHRLTSGLLEPDYWTHSLDIPDHQAEMEWQAMSNALCRMVQIAQNRKIPIAFIYIPGPYQYDPYYETLPIKLGLIVRKEWMTQESEVEKRIENLTKEQNVPFLNLTPYFRKAAKDPNSHLNFHVDQHWSPQGHKLAAEIISKWLKDEKIVGG